MKFKNYYAVLKIRNFANYNEVKKAYRLMANQFHPDKNKSSDAQDRFIEINEAYSILIDETKKLIYDEILNNQLNNTSLVKYASIVEKEKKVEDWISFERARLFEMLRNKTDKGLTETFYFLEQYGRGIIIFVLLIFFIASLTFIK